ncbi:MAG: hypothetical protein ISR44_07005 [Rhodospirillales bacterium]|nr:hypothetical protein [Rhodospirillales bacterium]
MHTSLSRTPSTRLGSRGIAMAALLLALGACNMNAQVNPMEGIGFREARFQEVSAMRQYRQCRDDAIALDEQARATGNAGRYLASARLFEKCEAEVGPEAAGVAQDERMRAYALSVQNYLKGGDVAKAGENFEAFQKAFPGQDLYFHDGSSFIETMAALFGHKKDSDFGRFAMLNVNDTLKGEMRRVNYWKRN